MPIRVLMFGWELPPCNSGGLGVACYGLSQALVQSDVDVTFVLPKKVPVRADFLRLVFADLSGFDWPNFSPYLNINGTPLSDSQVSDLISLVHQYSLKAAAIAKKHHCALIHAHDGLCFPAGIAASQATGVPLVSHVHATEYDRSGGASIDPMVYALEKQGMDQADAVIAVSNFTKNLLAKYYLTPPEKVNVVHNGINPDDFTPEDLESNPLSALKRAGFKIVLYVGRLSLQKGPDYFIKAARRVLDFAPQTVFILVGSGDMEGQLINMTAGLGLSDKVLFAGFLRGQLHKQAFQAADLFVMPSVSEPFGITALEAVAHGTPAIISKQSGVSETLSHVLKVDFWDVDEMANQILSVLKYNSLHTSLKTNGHQEVKKVSWAAAAAKTIEIYKKILSAKK